MIGSLIPARQLCAPQHRFIIHRSDYLSRSESFTIDLIKHDAMALSTTASLFSLGISLGNRPHRQNLSDPLRTPSPLQIQTVRLYATRIPPVIGALQYPFARRAHGCRVRVPGSERRGSSDPLNRPSLTDHAGRMRLPHG